METLTLKQTRRLLARSKNVLTDSRIEGELVPRPFPDLPVSCRIMTHSEYRRVASGFDIRYGFFESAFGVALVMQTGDFLCGLAFVPDDESGTLAEMRDRWESARFTEDIATITPVARRVFTASEVNGEKAKKPISLLLRGTDFQTQVWQTLLRIPPGCVVSYKQVASSLGHPNAVRAAGGAVANNPIAYLLPCHRVIRGDGMIGGYHWGALRKAAMLAKEAALYPNI